MMTTERAPTKKSSERTCAGCGGKGAPSDMVRVVMGPDHVLAIDLAGGGFGRGAHVHPGCIEKACKGGFSRVFKQQISVKADELHAMLRDAADRRTIGLLTGARRAKHLAIGADDACSALEKGAFAVVASDAGAVARRSEVQQAVSEGRAVSFGNKQVLGALCGREEVALLGVTNVELAEQVKRCIEMSR